MLTNTTELPDGGYRCEFTPESLNDWLSLRVEEPDLARRLLEMRGNGEGYAE